MFSPRFDEALRQMLEELLRAMPAVTSGDLFGHPVWSVHGTLFACLSGEAIAFRLERNTAKDWLHEPGVEPFAPLGGNLGMSEWIQVCRDLFDDPDSFVPIRDAAYDYALRRSGVEAPYRRTSIP
ncbi:MAG: TfoX/Sxy family protein [Chlorobiaceae bacterium]|nr:TfoX/Sxy family protein [Chlorobiaceae bacterium]NTW74529.1 TfoX/Sxy family protein [Chlorobiaceae bacterium]